jgi:pimeloyl-[acyl-carrier protein] methyl ester esterase
MKLVLLPGMDGTSRLFAPLRAVLPAEVQVEPVTYPMSRPLGYEGLLNELKLPTAPHVLVGESFSGPLALWLAARKPPGLRAVVLVASFVLSPVAMKGVLRALVRPWLFRRPPPDWVLRRYLVGEDASAREVEAVRAAIASVSPDVMAVRLRQVLCVDAREALRSCPVSVTYLRGTKDRLVPASMMEGMREILPSMATVEIDAAHLVLQCRPIESAAAIVQVMNKCQ